ncbi:MAG: DUF59 domain-containing protein [Ignavibacteriae bacterium]|nr:DUF59 domain-containing protein [Ignavibacteriota bacterium]
MITKDLKILKMLSTYPQTLDVFPSVLRKKRFDHFTQKKQNVFEVYNIDETENNITVILSLTTPGCPMHDSITQWAENAV